MKTKKALKRLNKVAVLLSTVIDQLPDDTDGLGDLLNSAKANVVHAASTLNSQPSSGAGKSKPPAKAEKAKPRRLSAEGRKRISLAAKKRWEIARRKGVNPVTGRRLSKTT